MQRTEKYFEPDAFRTQCESVIFFRIPRFLPVENSLRICYDKKQRYSHKMLKMRKVIACVKVES